MEILNLEQIRAKDAYNAVWGEEGAQWDLRGKNGGDIVKKIPVFIRDNGLLATFAYAMEIKKAGGQEVILKNTGHHNVCAAIVRHLKNCKMIEPKIDSPEALFKKLTSRQDVTEIDLALLLRLVTTEALLYMDYLRRFVPDNVNDNAQNNDDGRGE